MSPERVDETGQELGSQNEISFSGLLKEARSASRISMRSLAKRAGIDASHVMRIERGDSNPSTRVVVAFADVLGHSRFDFLEAAGKVSVNIEAPHIREDLKALVDDGTIVIK